MDFEKRLIRALQQLGMPNNVTLVLSDRGGVEPKAPYLLINIINSVNVSMPTKSTTHELGNDVENVFQVKDILVGLTFHADSKDSVHDWVQHFQAGIYSDMADYAFTQQGLGLVRADNIMYQPAPVNGSAYKRAIMNITFRFEVHDKFVVNNLFGVDVEGKLTDELGSHASDVIVNVEKL